MPDVLVLGAGISGLTVAFRLQEASPNFNITVLEPRNRPGGTIWTERQNGFQIEIGPNGFLDSKPSTSGLCRELGLGDRLVSASAGAAKNRFLLVDGRLKRMPAGLWDIARTDLLSWRGKLSLLMEPFRSGRLDSADESVADFATRRGGKEAAAVFADALTTGIHGGDPALLSVRAAFPRLAALEREHGSVVKGMRVAARERRERARAAGQKPAQGGQMWSFREGLRLLVETLAARLRRPPLYGLRVERISVSDHPTRPRWLATAAGKDAWSADAIVLACPAQEQQAVLNEFDSELGDAIGKIPYNRVAVVALGFRKDDVPMPLDGFGYIAPQSTRRDLLGVQWCSSIFADRAPAGTVLLRALCGGWHRPEVVGWDDARLTAAVRAELQLAMGIQAAPIAQYIVRWDRAIPQYHLGHLERVAMIEALAARHRGLFLAGNAYRGVALNDCTEQAATVAHNVANYLSTTTTVC